ncbi:MAG: hypothetical protein JXA57_12455 [Armatimonadetes bacterium]|nr:hypothetical protein [Armatimonadota bacterium]
MNDRLSTAITCLRISTVLYVFVAIIVAFLLLEGSEGAAASTADNSIPIFLIVACLGLAIVPEVAIVGIKRRRFWGWALALIIFGLYIPSLFLPLGVIGLKALLDSASRAEMGIH